MYYVYAVTTAVGRTNMLATMPLASAHLSTVRGLILANRNAEINAT